MSDGDGREVEQIAALARAFGVDLRPEHAPEVLQAWRLMASHRALISVADLGPELEPAALFKP